jgi:hypothetical protein
MEKLGPLVFFYRPSPSASTIAKNQPRLIIIGSWTGAKDIHIAKYVAKYQSLYPAAQILLLKSTMGTIFRPSQIGPAMKVAAPVVRAAFQTPMEEEEAPILIHMFSNGGSSSVANLYDQFAATAGPNDDKHLPPHVTILDSCPGQFHMQTAVAFVAVGLPPLQRLVLGPFMYALAALWIALMAVGVLPSVLKDWARAHNDRARNSKEVRRVYVYSPIDALIDWRDVERHADEARTKGFEVKLEKFEGSAHVAHLRKDEGRYWGIVKRAMEGSRP